MQYRSGRQGESISILGYGCMRFTRTKGAIDLDKAQREVAEAVASGVNYLDTAYVYPGNEAAVGQILQRSGLREKVFLATKLPQYLVRSRSAMDRYLTEQLRRLQTDHIDFYLLHMLSGKNSWERLVALGIQDWIREKKAQGSIRRIGFSFHGNTASFLELLDCYDWDFCQIQYNYMDETTQAGRRGLEAAQAKGIPVIIMEPLRGGRLTVGLPPQARELLAAEGRGRSAAEWGLRWLWNQPGVTCVLSGMNSLEMVQENCRIADLARPGEMTEADFALIARLKEAIAQSQRVGCTGCGYCQPCPHGVDIPGVFRCWNEIGVDGAKRARREYLQTTAMRSPSTGAGQCVGCGKCEQHCPQAIPIRQALREARHDLETPLYHLTAAAYRLLKI